MSRESVGLRLVNLLGERQGWRWSRFPAAQCDVAQKSTVLFAKPLTYVRVENGRAMRLLRQTVVVDNKNVILVYPDTELDVGQIQFGPGASSRSVCVCTCACACCVCLPVYAYYVICVRVCVCTCLHTYASLRRLSLALARARRKLEFLAEFVPGIDASVCTHLAIGIGQQALRADVLPTVSLNSDDDLLEKQFFANRLSNDDERLLTTKAFERAIEILKRETGLHD